MKHLPFVKYTSYGNNFVIIDETMGQVLTEEEKSSFAFQATNPYFGVGCDNLLVIQKCSSEVLADINRAREYWPTPPDPNCAEFIFRMFEPNGEEAFSCGNGLMCIAHHLHRRYEIESTSILTEVPFEQPRAIEIGAFAQPAYSWADVGEARRVPLDLVTSSARKPVDEAIDLVADILIRFRAYDLAAYTSERTLQMSGYLVFTGEPHLVIFPDDSFSNPELAQAMFSASTVPGVVTKIRRRVSLGSWLARRIGVFLNDSFRSHFPAGINVNFARVDPDSSRIEYRCFERGINRETLACGTGAVAVAVVAKRMEMTEGSTTTVLPHLCRWHDKNAEIRVDEGRDGHWRLQGSPRLLFEAGFALQRRDSADTRADEADEFDTMDLLRLENVLISPRLTS